MYIENLYINALVGFYENHYKNTECYTYRILNEIFYSYFMSELKRKFMYINFDRIRSRKMQFNELHKNLLI